MSKTLLAAEQEKTGEQAEGLSKLYVETAALAARAEAAIAELSEVRKLGNCLRFHMTDVLKPASRCCLWDASFCDPCTTVDPLPPPCRSCAGRCLATEYLRCLALSY